MDAAGYNYYEFTIPAAATISHIEGSFTSSGGSGNDIKVLIMDAKAFTNWENGHEVVVYYTSEQLTQDSF